MPGYSAFDAFSNSSTQHCRRLLYPVLQAQTMKMT